MLEYRHRVQFGQEAIVRRVLLRFPECECVQVCEAAGSAMLKVQVCQAAGSAMLRLYLDWLDLNVALQRHRAGSATLLLVSTGRIWLAGMGGGSSGSLLRIPGLYRLQARRGGTAPACDLPMQHSETWCCMGAHLLSTDSE